jgi:hypothetical protein
MEMKKMIQILALALFLPMALIASEEKGMSVKERMALLQKNQKSAQPNNKRRGRRRKKGGGKTAQLAQNLTKQGLTGAIIAGAVRGNQLDKKRQQRQRQQQPAAVSTDTQPATTMDRPVSQRRRRPQTRKKTNFASSKATPKKQPVTKRQGNTTADFSGQLTDARNKPKMRALYPFEGGEEGIPSTYFNYEDWSNDEDWSNIDFDDDEKTITVQAQRNRGIINNPPPALSDPALSDIIQQAQSNRSKGKTHSVEPPL